MALDAVGEQFDFTGMRALGELDALVQLLESRAQGRGLLRQLAREPPAKLVQARGDLVRARRRALADVLEPAAQGILLAQDLGLDPRRGLQALVDADRGLARGVVQLLEG